MTNKGSRLRLVHGDRATDGDRNARVERFAAAWTDATMALGPDDLSPASLISLSDAALEIHVALRSQFFLAGGELPAAEDDDAEAQQRLIRRPFREAPEDEQTWEIHLRPKPFLDEPGKGE